MVVKFHNLKVQHKSSVYFHFLCVFMSRFLIIIVIITSWGWAGPSSDQLQARFVSFAYRSSLCLINQVWKSQLVKLNWLNQVDEIKLIKINFSNYSWIITRIRSCWTIRLGQLGLMNRFDWVKLFISSCSDHQFIQWSKCINQI